MAVTEQEVDCFQGEDLALTFTVLGSDPVGTMTLSFVLRKVTAGVAGAALVTKATADMTVDGTARTVVVPLTPADTDQTPGRYVGQLWRTNAGTRNCLAEIWLDVALPTLDYP
jgi:hypothetical protein